MKRLTLLHGSAQQNPEEKIRKELQRLGGLSDGDIVLFTDENKNTIRGTICWDEDDIYRISNGTVSICADGGFMHVPLTSIHRVIARLGDAQSSSRASASTQLTLLDGGQSEDGEMLSEAETTRGYVANPEDAILTGTIEAPILVDGKRRLTLHYGVYPADAVHSVMATRGAAFVLIAEDGHGLEIHGHFSADPDIDDLAIVVQEALASLLEEDIALDPCDESSDGIDGEEGVESGGLWLVGSDES